MCLGRKGSSPCLLAADDKRRVVVWPIAVERHCKVDSLVQHTKASLDLLSVGQHVGKAGKQHMHWLPAREVAPQLI